MAIGGRAPEISGKGEGKTEVKEDSIGALKDKFKETTDKIRKIIGGRNDKKDFRQEERDELRRLYTTAARLAKDISNRVTDEADSAKYFDFYKKLSDSAASYGSVMKNEIPKTTMDDIKGLDNVKKLVDSFLFMAQNPDILKYYKMEGGLGVLMYGAPGTGKTMFAEAIANRMQLPLFIVTPADIFKSYVGASEQAVRAIFEDIESCPDGAVLFIDECESIFSRRTDKTEDYKSAVTTELLQRINGFGVDGSKRIMVGATNRPEMIDPAYLRYKRFSYLIHVTPPDFDARKAIIESKLKGIALSGITLDEIVAMTNGTASQLTNMGYVPTEDAYYSAADICGIIEEACRLTLEKVQESGKRQTLPLTREVFEKAFKQIPPGISATLLQKYEDFRKSIKS